MLRDTDGAVHAWFDTAAEIFTDASAYPEDGDRNIKPPIIPEYELTSDVWSDVERDIAVVPHPSTDDEDKKERLTPMDLTLYRDEEPNVPLTELLDDEQPTGSDEADEDLPSSGSGSDQEDKAATIDAAISTFENGPQDGN